MIPIVCANCGAKYRLPETFKSDRAKCKACGASIDVASQRESKPDEAAAQPAPAPIRFQSAALAARPSAQQPQASGAAPRVL